MASAAQLKKVSKAIYRIAIGCASLQFKEPDDLTSNLSVYDLWDIVCRNIKEEKAVVRLESGLPAFFEQPMATRWIHPKPFLGKELQINQRTNPIITFMKYPIHEIDPEVHLEPHQLIEGILLYDGFLSLWGTQSMNLSLNYQRHAARLNWWLKNVVRKGNVSHVPFELHNPPGLYIEIYFLSSVPKGETKEEYETQLLKYQSRLGNRFRLSYLLGPGEGISDALQTALLDLYDDAKVILTDYFLAKMLNGVLDIDTEIIDDFVNKAGDELVKYYRIHFLNIPSRYKKTQDIGKVLANICTIMPDFEHTVNEYEARRKSLVAVEQYGFKHGLSQFLVDRLRVRAESPFTHSINEMLRHEVSEVRSQVNAQLLLFSAFIALLSVIITAAVSMLA